MVISITSTVRSFSIIALLSANTHAGVNSYSMNNGRPISLNEHTRRSATSKILDRNLTVKSILELSVSSRASSISDNDEEVERKSTFDINMRGGGNTSNKDDSNVSVGRWPCGDALDKQLIKIALPCIANFAINPLVGAVDLFWVSKMGNALAVAGQSAANQVFNSAFWLISFLPSVTATLVAKESAKKSEEGVQDAVSQALVVGTMMAIIGTILILSNPSSVLSAVLSGMCQDYNFFLFL